MYVDKGMSSNKIAKIYNCDGSTILKYLKKWGVQIRKERVNSIYSLDTTFFEKIDSEEKAYLVGLLLADGHVSKNNAIMITLKDLDTIQKFKHAIKSNARIKIDRYGNYQFSVSSKVMSDDLRKMGFTNRKSYEIDIDLVLSFIPREYEHHFVRGLFDGDGSIKIYKYSYQKSPQLHFGFTGLINVVKYIKGYLGLHTKTVKESEITYTCVSSCKKTIIDIYNILYKDATIYMERKYNTFRKII